jgi:CDGSH-type Zn-finger protein
MSELMGERFAAPGVVICPGGPMLVRGAKVIQADDGTAHEVDRPVVALCRCQKSQALPWCDATHKLLPDDKRP